MGSCLGKNPSKQAPQPEAQKKPQPEAADAGKAKISEKEIDVKAEEKISVGHIRTLVILFRFYLSFYSVISFLQYFYFTSTFDKAYKTFHRLV